MCKVVCQECGDEAEGYIALQMVARNTHRGIQFAGQIGGDADALPPGWRFEVTRSPLVRPGQKDPAGAVRIVCSKHDAEGRAIQ